MRVFEIRDNFGIDSLVVAELAEPVPGPGQIVIKLRAASLNYRDLLVVNGVGRWGPSSPRIPVSDGVGIVVAAGSGVSRVKTGDRVAPIFNPKWLDGKIAPEKQGPALGGAVADGLLAEYALFNENCVVHVPEHLSDEEAATLPCAGVTAWQGLVSAGRLEPGNTVVVLGTGGVSIFSLQFAKLLGARVIVTSSSDEKLARAEQLGAAGINYKANPDWPRAVLELTGGLGAEHIVDTVGDLKESIAAVRVGGTVSFIGLLSGMTTMIDLVAFMGKSAHIEAIDVGSREMFEAMNHAIGVNGVRPVVDRVFDFSEAREALKYLAEGKHFGKVCLRF